MSASEPTIRLDVDGPYSDTGFARRLVAALDGAGTPDSYGEGPLIRDCEAALAKALGKERAVLFATGTLANLVALDRHCGRHARRVLVHPDSHVLNDTGDSLASVMGLTAAVAAPSGAGFAAPEIAAAVAGARSGKVAQGLGAVCIETPVRRRRNAAFPQAMLAETVAAARRAKIGLHLDGARLPIAATAAGTTMAAFAADYDTVYLSLWKMLGLPFGAVLAGPAALLDGVEHDRRRHGGALPQFWPVAAVTLAELDRLEGDWRLSFEWLRAFERALLETGGPATEAVDEVPTNCIWLRPGIGPAAYKAKCREAGVVLGDIDGDRVLVRANPTLRGTEPQALARILARADS
jgi:threonine aldolase